MSVKASSYRLNICCIEHPNYRGKVLSKTCDTCKLLHVLIHQNDKVPEEKLGGNNPYAYILSGVNLEEACAGLLVKTELVASRLQFNPRPHDSFIDEPHVDYRAASLREEMRKRLAPPSKKKELVYEDTKHLLIL